LTAEAGLVSVVIPTYNRARTLIDTVKSVLGQTYPRVEALVVDDCSTDTTPTICAELCEREPRVRYFRLGSNRGANVARNHGLLNARGSFVCFLDSDDLYRPQKIALQMRALEADPLADVCVCQISIFRRQPGDTQLVWNRLNGQHPLLRYAAADMVWGTAAPLWRRSALERIGPWDETLPFHQDTEYHLRALVLGARVVVLPEVLEDYRAGELDTITASGDKQERGGVVLLRVYESCAALARERGLLDGALRREFAQTFALLALDCARTRAQPESVRARASYSSLEPNAWRRQVILPILDFAIGLRGRLRPAYKALFALLRSAHVLRRQWRFVHATSAQLESQIVYDSYRRQ
jgi:glycosyltransferase involved in cell wall biosynthesis